MTSFYNLCGTSYNSKSFRSSVYGLSPLKTSSTRAGVFIGFIRCTVPSTQHPAQCLAHSWCSITTCQKEVKEGMEGMEGHSGQFHLTSYTKHRTRYFSNPHADRLYINRKRDLGKPFQQYNPQRQKLHLSGLPLCAQSPEGGERHNKYAIHSS